MAPRPSTNSHSPNIYLEDVHVAAVRTSCGCTSVRIANDSLKTYEKGAIVATFNTPSFLGQHGATITVTFDKPFYAEVQLHVSGYIRSDVVFDPGSVQIGDLKQGAATPQQVDRQLCRPPRLEDRQRPRHQRPPLRHLRGNQPQRRASVLRNDRPRQQHAPHRLTSTST